MDTTLYVIKVSISREIRDSDGRLVKNEQIYAPMHLRAFKSLVRAIKARDYLFASRIIKGKLERIAE